MRNFRIMPEGLENADEFLKTFWMYVAALAPSCEELGRYLRYKIEEKKIMDTDFTKEIDIRSDVLEMTAEALGMSVEEYIKKLANEKREEKLKELNEKYGYKEINEKEQAIKEANEKIKKYYKKLEQQWHDIQ